MSLNPMRRKPRYGSSLGSRKSLVSSSSDELNGGTFRLLLDTLEIGVAEITRQGKILYSNRHFAEGLNLPAKRDLAGTLLGAHVSSRNWSDLSSAIDSAVLRPVEAEIRVSKFNSNKTMRVCFVPLPQSNTVCVTTTEVTTLRETKAELERSEKAVTDLSNQLMQIQDNERRRMARELHDVTGQELAVAMMSLDSVSQNLEAPRDEMRASLDACRNEICKVVADIRTLSYVLHPPMIDEMGICSALAIFTEGFAKRTGIEVNLQVPKNLQRLPIEKELNVFRIIQECLTNVFRHSGSQKAWVSLTLIGRRLRAEVRDEGRGMPEAKAKQTSGVGVQSMAGRARLAGGEFRIQSSSRGTKVTVTVPLGEDDVLFPGPDASRSSRQPSVPDQHSSSNARKRVMIADDHEVTRKGLKALLADQPDLEICGEAEDGLDVVEKAHILAPDLIIMDLNMPNVGGFSAANQIRQAGIESRILIFSSHSYPGIVKMARATGCQGYVHKSNAGKDLVRATRSILNGREFFEAAPAPRPHPGAR